VCSLALDDLSVGCDQFAGHHAQASEALCKDVALYVTVVVLGGPDKSAGGLDSLCDHVVDEAMLVVDAGFLEEGFVLCFVDFLEDILEPAIVFLEDSVLGRHELWEEDAPLDEVGMGRRETADQRHLLGQRHLERGVCKASDRLNKR
jgi:hypothetical protein